MLLTSGQEMYGLEIVQASNGEVGRGTVYVTLGRMVEKGFVDSRQETLAPSSTALPRRMYRVTAEGRRVLHACERASLAYAGALK